MQADLVLITILTILAAIALVGVVLLPAWIGWWVAWRYGIQKADRRSFAIISLLLTYGVLTLAGALLLPLGVFQTFLAPDLHARGYETLATAIFVVAEDGVPIVSLAAGVLASIVIPMRLRGRWSAIREVVSADAASHLIGRNAE